MTKKLLWALLIMALTVIVMILNRGSTTLSFGFFRIQALASFVYLMFMVAGVIVGVLLK